MQSMQTSLSVYPMNIILQWLPLVLHMWEILGLIFTSIDSYFDVCVIFHSPSW